MRIAALAGGVGGAKLADGLQRAAGRDLTVIVNTGDDFELHGLFISPDLDTVMYTLAGIANPATGWGIDGDTFSNLEMMSRYGAPEWFRLGDRDLATHILRTEWLRRGETLTTVTGTLCRSLGVGATVLPMCDERVATIVSSDEGELAFQEYFVRRRWQPAVRSVRFGGIEQARPSVQVLDAIEQAELVLLCPSNPFVSIEPILSLHGMRDRMASAAAPRVAVSPIVGGEALKGPAAKMFQELGTQPSALAVARRYQGLINGFVLDRADEALRRDIEGLGMKVLMTDTVMREVGDRERLARQILEWKWQ